jgi:hypothetical protein
MIDLNKIWNLRKPFLRNGICLDDFLCFLGVGKNELINLSAEEFKALSPLDRHKLVYDGFNFNMDYGTYVCRWKFSNNGSSNTFSGRGNSFEEAALYGLLNYFEFMLNYKEDNDDCIGQMKLFEC